jgi:hypothetical protein
MDFLAELEMTFVLNQKRDALQYILFYLQKETKKMTQG